GRPPARERVGLGFNRNVRVDERPAADAGALNHGHVRKDFEVEPAVAGRRIGVVPDPRIVGLAWKVRGGPAPPALEHNDLGARGGEPARVDGAAETATDDENVAVDSHEWSMNCRGTGELLAVHVP